MELERTTGRRSAGARKPAGRRTTASISGPATLAMAAAGALGGIVVAKRRRAAAADEPLEPNGRPEREHGSRTDEAGASAAAVS